MSELINLDRAIARDLLSRRLTDFRIDINLFNTDSSAFDTTNFEFEFQVINQGVSLFTLTTGSGLTVNANQIQLRIDDASYTFAAGNYYYQFKVTNATGVVEYWLNGRFFIFENSVSNAATVSDLINLTIPASSGNINLTVNSNSSLDFLIIDQPDPAGLTANIDYLNAQLAIVNFPAVTQNFTIVQANTDKLQLASYDLEVQTSPVIVTFPSNFVSGNASWDNVNHQFTFNPGIYQMSLRKRPNNDFRIEFLGNLV